MASFSVTSSEMTKKLSDLQTKNEGLKKQITKMKESKDELNSTWEGVAKKNFNNAVENDVIQMKNFCKLIEQYSAALEKIVNNYAVTEANNANMISKRKY